MKVFLRNLFRRKQNLTNNLETPLLRCLNLFDLIFLSVSGMIGSGIYVLTGVVAKRYTGPAIIISNILAACACLFGALCYAEFAARIPRAGSSYIYIYESLGEILAFLVGFTSIVGGLTSLGVSARVWSAYFDALFDNRIRLFITKYISWPNASTPFAKYPDFLALTIAIGLIVPMLAGVKNSKYLTNSLTIVNMFALVFIGITGFLLGNRNNYQTFLPFGIQGLFRGSSLLIYSYLGFEMATIAIEEAKEPSKTVPRATVISVLLVALLYSFAEASLTYLIPYQNINPDSAFAHAYSLSKWPWTSYLISLAIVFSAGGNLLSGLYGTIRTIYAMSTDGLLPSRLSVVSKERHVPVIATCLACVIIACLSTFFDIKDLIGFTDISALLSYTGVSIGLIYERYNHPTSYQVILLNENDDDDIDEEKEIFELSNQENDPIEDATTSHQLDADPLLTRFVRSFCRPCLPLIDSYLSPKKSAILLLIFFLLNTIFLAILIIHRYQHGNHFHLILILFFLIIHLILLWLFCLLKPRQTSQSLLFTCPGFPLTPLININIFIFLMVFQDAYDWLAYTFIIVLSLFLYFFYGYSHSKSN